MNCFSKFKENLLIRLAKQEKECPIYGCKGIDIVRLDDSMADAVITLNRKGYITNFSSQGDINDQKKENYFQTYLSINLTKMNLKFKGFKDCISLLERYPIVASLPEGLSYEVNIYNNEYLLTIEFIDQIEDNAERFERMAYAQALFFKYSQSLPDFNRKAFYRKED